MEGLNNIEHRQCGECSACCTTHRVEGVTEADEKCRYCGEAGCDIYKRRPPQCAAFKCEWLKGKGDLEDRPDKTGAVLEESEITLITGRSFPVILVVFDKNFKGDRDNVRKITDVYKRQNFIIVTYVYNEQENNYELDVDFKKSLFKDKYEKEDALLEIHWKF